ncbi:unnamed protein product [Fraxinus pennsylvanica]|uniref:Uncharacterized protein n=1 Tax=Fraxinus pennsylvanica TaxID=56036 RepID=A0AAD2A4H2_9LAMI|nr:unnamed protein product [Fraxinus pennsylvanica]
MVSQASSVGELIREEANSINSRSITDPNSPYYLHCGDNTERFIDGTITEPESDDPLHSTLRRCNHVVSLWIINFIPNELYPSVMHKDSVREIWIELKDRYRQDQVMQFLMGLDEHYSGVRSRILLMDPLPLLNKVVALILQDERQKKRKDKLICSHRGIARHIKVKCLKIVGYLPGHRFFGGINVVANAVGQSSDSGSQTVMESFSNLTITPDQCKEVLVMLMPQLIGQITNVPRIQTQSQPQDTSRPGYSVPMLSHFQDLLTWKMIGMGKLENGLTTTLILENKTPYEMQHHHIHISRYLNASAMLQVSKETVPNSTLEPFLASFLAILTA